MLCHHAVFAILVALASSAPEAVGDVPDYLLPLFPEDFVEYLESLTPKETSALKTVAQEHGPFKERGELLYVLSSKGGKSLYKKNMKLEFALRRKIVQLEGEAKYLAIHFTNGAHSIYENLLSDRKPTFPEIKEMVRSYIKEFNNLPEASQEKIKTLFPTLTNLISMPFIVDIFNWKPGQFVQMDA